MITANTQTLRASKGQCHTFSQARPFRATVARLSTPGMPEACAGRAHGLAFEALAALEARVSSNDGQSELMRLQEAPAGKPVAVSDALWHLIRLANEISFRTDGIFDATATGSGGRAHWTDIDLSRRGYVRFRKRLRLDLGGVVKGYATDIAVQALREMGARCGLVDIGGVMRAFGPQEWRVQYDFAHGVCPLPVPLLDGALAGGGANGGRLFNPQTGIFHSGREWGGLRFLVRARSAALADGLAKVALLAPARSHSLLPRLGATVATLTPEGVRALEYAS